MKNKSKIKVEQSRKETVFTMETVLFTNLSERKVKSKSAIFYYDFLDFIAFENKLQAVFTPFFVHGVKRDIEKAQNILINSVKYN